MYDIKQKPKMDKPKMLDRTAAMPRNISDQMRQKYQEELSKKQPEERQVSNTYAVDRLEEAAGVGASASLSAGKRAIHSARVKAKDRKQQMNDRKTATDITEPKEQSWREAGSDQTRGRKYAAEKFQAQIKTRQAVQRGADSAAFLEQQELSLRNPMPRQAAREKAVLDGKQKAQTGRQMKRAQAAGYEAKKRSAIKKQMEKRVSPAQQAKQKAKREAQQQMARQAAQTAKAAAKTMARAAAAIGKAIAASVKAIAAAIAAAGPGAILVIAIILFAVVAAVIASPFGIFFSGEDTAADVMPVSQVVAECNAELAAEIDGICQSNPHDRMTLNGQTADWAAVLAVFAVNTAGGEGETARDVVTIDAARVAVIKEVFGAMNRISYTVENIEHGDSSPDDEIDDSYTETILHITIESKTAEEMASAYAFTDTQWEMLAALLEERVMLAGLAGSLSVTSADAAEILRNLPADLPAERKAVIQTAMQLVGKVGYFWGGKSSVIGWDSRWGTPKKVTADGSSTSGTIRAFGLDCSGYVDWVFNNAHGYVIGHGGGAASQHTYCTNLSWNEAQIGDLVFYPDDSHVGIVCGFDENGDVLIVHCASGYNNVVITSKEGFTSVGRPDFYEEAALDGAA